MGGEGVGKTFLVRSFFKSKIKFEVAGLHNGSMADQLGHFARTLTKHGWASAAVQPPRSWGTAFDMLEMFLDSKRGNGKKVIFLDELPWFDTPKSKFLMAFENFWNSYCTKRNDLLVIICGHGGFMDDKKGTEKQRRAAQQGG